MIGDIDRPAKRTVGVDVSQELRALVPELCRRHPVFPQATIERLVRRTFEQYQDAKITTYVPLLVRRTVAAQLRYLDDGMTS